MAKHVKVRGGKEFVFKEVKGFQSRYPWEEWLKGDLLQIEQSAGTKDEDGRVTEVSKKNDFEVTPDEMVGKLRGAARRRFKVVKISKVDQDGKLLEDSLIIQARDMTPEEKESEKARRAGRKAKRLEKKRAKKELASAPAE